MPDNQESARLIRRAVDDGCLTYTESRDLTCFYCGGSVSYNRYGPDTVNHEPDCLFVAMQAATERKDKRP